MNSEGICIQTQVSLQDRKRSNWAFKDLGKPYMMIVIRRNSSPCQPSIEERSHKTFKRVLLERYVPSRTLSRQSSQHTFCSVILRKTRIMRDIWAPLVVLHVRKTSVQILEEAEVVTQQRQIADLNRV